MLAARAGMPRSIEMAVMRAAFSACSRSMSTVWPSTSAVQPLVSSRLGYAAAVHEDEHGRHRAQADHRADGGRAQRRHGSSRV